MCNKHIISVLPTVLPTIIYLIKNDIMIFRVNMEHIPKEDLDEMDLDEQMNSDQEEDDEEGSETEEEGTDDREKEIFIPGKHKLEEGEELVRDERFVHFMGTYWYFFVLVLIHFIMNFKLDRHAYHSIL